MQKALKPPPGGGFREAHGWCAAPARPTHRGKRNEHIGVLRNESEEGRTPGTKGDDVDQHERSDRHAVKQVGTQGGFEGKPEFVNPAGSVQGGFLTAMLDETIGPVVLLKSDGALYPSSIDINVSFLGAAKPGPLVCEGEVLRLGKTVGFVEGRLMDNDGRQIARATSSVMLVPAQRVG